MNTFVSLLVTVIFINLAYDTHMRLLILLLMITITLFFEGNFCIYKYTHESDLKRPWITHILCNHTDVYTGSGKYGILHV